MKILKFITKGGYSISREVYIPIEDMTGLGILPLGNKRYLTS